MAKKQIKRKYGWHRDLPDHRDMMMEMPLMAQEVLPEVVDLRPGCPPVYDQGKLGSCTANAIAAAYEFDQIKQTGKHDYDPSRLFIYYNERILEGTVKIDAGAQIRDGMKVINQFGVCSEALWPYNISKFAVRPPDTCFTQAMGYKSVVYQRVGQTLNELQTVLASGFPIVFGFSVYESFESATVAKTGIMPMPSKKERCLGGHAVLLVGINIPQKMFIVRNSWGEGWGGNMKGYFMMPFDYATNRSLASDFWTLQKVTKLAG